MFGMSSWRISRRTFLHGTGVALGLPLLDVMEPKSARAAAIARPPVRLGCVYMPNGVPFDAWKPESVDGRVTGMNRWMSSFEPLKEHLQFLTGLQSDSNQTHQAGSATWLIRPGSEGEEINETKDVGGTSMDQIVARSLRGATPFSSLELITQGMGTNTKDLLLNNISWRNGKTPVPRENNPRALFNRLVGTDSTGILGANRASQQSSILDAVLEDANSLRHRISGSDQYKIDEYMDAVRNVEKRTSDSAVALQAIARERAATMATPPEELPEDHAEYLRLMFDMMVLAYWSDSTRVATFMLDHEESNRFVNFIPGVKGMWHSLSHWRSIEAGGDNFDGTSWTTQAIKYEQYLKVIEFHHEQMAYFLTRLSEIQEGDGTLLDHCMILYGSPFADGHEHQSTDLPVMIAGKADGKIRPGRMLEYDNEPLEGVFLSMMDVMGVAVHEFGGVDTAVAIS